MSSTLTIRATSATTHRPNPIAPAGIADKTCPSPTPAHEWQGYIPFDQMPNTFDPPSGFLATANSRVTTDKSQIPAQRRLGRSLSRRAHLQTAARPRPAQACRHAGHANRHLQRNGSGAWPSLCLRHRPHPVTLTTQLRQAADLMRSWDGRLATSTPPLHPLSRRRATPWPHDSGAQARERTQKAISGPNQTLPSKKS